MRELDFLIKSYRYILNSNNNRIATTWLFGEWFGKRTGDNVTYFANYLAQSHKDLSLYWLCNNSCNTDLLNRRIKVLDYSSEEAIAISRKAAVAVMGEGISDLSHDITNYWGNAVKVNLWHGIPWKKIGYDSRKKKENSIIESIRSHMYRYDVYETPSDEYSKHIKSAFNTSENSLIKAGLPRNVLFYDQDGLQDCRDKVFGKCKLQSPARLAIYLPTFRDAQTKPFSFTDIREASFHEWLERNNIYIIQKAHAAETGAFSGTSSHIINIKDISAQELMAASDMLITDYSSCFFDYLLLDRPIIHFLYDYDFYKNKDRGLYYEKEEVVCGAAPENENDLIKAIQENFENPGLFHDLRMERKAKFMTYEGPDSCEIITQRIFGELKKRGMGIK